MSTELSLDQKSTVTVLLNAGKTIKEISKFADLDRVAVTEIARNLNLEPSSPTLRRAKALFGSSESMTYAEVATSLKAEGLQNDGEPVHYLTVATWVANHGWAWGGSEDGNYAPDRVSSAPARSKYTLRMSKKLDAEVNSASAIAAASESAWEELNSDRTTVVAVAVVRGAASAGVTDIASVKADLMERHGESIRTARA